MSEGTLHESAFIQGMWLCGDAGVLRSGKTILLDAVENIGKGGAYSGWWALILQPYACLVQTERVLILPLTEGFEEIAQVIGAVNCKVRNGHVEITCPSSLSSGSIAVLIRDHEDKIPWPKVEKITFTL